MSIHVRCASCGVTLDIEVTDEFVAAVDAELGKRYRRGFGIQAQADAVGQPVCTCSRTLTDDPSKWSTGFTWEYRPCPVHGSPPLRQ